MSRSPGKCVQAERPAWNNRPPRVILAPRAEDYYALLSKAAHSNSPGSEPLENERHEAFCKEYLKDFNGTAAYGRAGYTASPDAARSGAPRLLANASVQARLSFLMQARAKRLDLDADWVLQELVDVEQMAKERKPVMRYDRDEKRLVQVEDIETGEGVYQIDAAGATRALDLIGKHLGMFGPKGTAEDPLHHRHSGIEITIVNAPAGGGDGAPG